MISKFNSIRFGYTRFSHLMLLCFFLVLSIILQPCPVHGEKYEGVPIIQKDARGQVKQYTTTLGKLNAGMLILKGSQMTKSGSKMEIKEGYFAIGSDGAVSITNPVKVFKGTPYQTLTPLLITFVQDLASLEWLATNGLLYVRRHQGHLLEGQKVKVVGGKDNPLIIEGQPFADTTLVIINGKPVKKAW